MKELAAVVVLIHTFPKLVNGEVRVNVAPLAGLIVNVCVFEGEAPVVVTPTVAVPAADRSDAGILAVNCRSLINVVVRFEPFQVTVELLLTKLVPFTVKVNPGSPTVADEGEMEVVVGEDTGVTEVQVVPTRMASIIWAGACAAVPWRRAILSIVTASAAPPLVVGGMVAEGSASPNTGLT